MDQSLKLKLLAHYKECYQTEMDRREKATARLTLNLAILTVSFNIALSFLNNLPPYDQLDWIAIGFYTLFAVGVALALVAVTFYLKALVIGRHHTYTYIPSTKAISTYFDEAEGYNQKVKPFYRINLEARFDDKLLEQYRDAADANRLNNGKRSAFLYWTSFWTVWSVIALLSCAPLFYIKKHLSPEKPQAIEIRTPIKVEQNHYERRHRKHAPGRTYRDIYRRTESRRGSSAARAGMASTGVPCK